MHFCYIFFSLLETKFCPLFNFYFSKQTADDKTCINIFSLLPLNGLLYSSIHAQKNIKRERTQKLTKIIHFISRGFSQCQHYSLHKWKLFCNRFWGMNISINSEGHSQTKTQTYPQRRTILLRNLFFILEDVVYSECRYIGRKGF